MLSFNPIKMLIQSEKNRLILEIDELPGRWDLANALNSSETVHSIIE